jgi:sigma-B regulation protein RsbU (phosphoserine phosphatase)
MGLDIKAADVLGGQNEQLEQQAELVAEITQGFVASDLTIEQTLHNALKRFMEYLDAEACSIFLIDDQDNELECRQCAGPVDIMGLRLGLTQGIVGKAIQSNSCQMIRDVRLDPDFASSVDKGTGFETRSVLCAPLTVRGKCLGALELLNKHSGDGLFDNQDRYLLTAMASAAALAIHQARTAERLVEQERVQKELELAREIQEKLLPEPIDGSFPVAGINLPAREVSGDFYDFFQLPDGRIYFNLADVSGKGMNAAMLMAKTSSLLHCLAKKIDDPATLLAQVNDEIFDTSTHGMFVTVVSGYLDPIAEKASFANAGHQPPMLLDSDGTFREYPADAPPIGILPGVEFPLTEVEIGDGALYLFTDGLTEQRDPGGNELSVAGLQEIILKHRGVKRQQRLLDIVKAVLGNGAIQRDDVTMMVLEC